MTARLEAVPLQSGGSRRDSGNIFAIGGSDAEAQAQGVDDAQDGREFGVAVSAEGAIEAFSRDTGFAGHFGHASSAGHDSEGVRDKGRVSAFEGFGHVGGDGFAVVEVFCGIEGFGFGFSHSPEAYGYESIYVAQVDAVNSTGRDSTARSRPDRNTWCLVHRGKRYRAIWARVAFPAQARKHPPRTVWALTGLCEGPV